MILLCAALIAAGMTSSFATTADLILKNGKIQTDHDAGRVWSQALSIRQGGILSIGTNAAIEKERGPATRVIDLKGRLVLPGFNDAHVHFLNGGLALTRIDLSAVNTVAKLQDKIKTYFVANPLKRWMFGAGLDQTQFAGQKYPTKEDLDAAITEKPILLWFADYHAAIVNSKALSILKIDDEKVNATGILFGSVAHAAAAKVDNPSREELKQAFKLAQESAAKSGVTSVQGGPFRGEDEVRVLEELHNANQLTLRYSMWGDLEKAEEFISLKEQYKHLHGEWIRFEALKGYLDGVLSARTAALLEPYSDNTKTSGEPFFTQSKLNELVLAANRQGLAVVLHASGDRAASMAVTAFSNARHLLFNSRVRNRVEHLEVVPPHVYDKFRELGLVAGLQPSHLVYENESQNFTEARLGSRSSRIRNTFATRSFFTARAHVAFGTDWPVMPFNPLLGLYGAVHRQHLNGRPSSGWQPWQKITLEQALEAYTLGSAYATREEHVKGTLREGKYADIVVLDKDIFKVRAKDWPKIGVYMTIVNGKIVFDGSQSQIGPAKTEN